MEKRIPEIRFRGFKDEWEKVKVDDFAETKSGGGTPSTKEVSFWQGTIPWFQTSDIKEDKVLNNQTEKGISFEAIEKSAAKIIKAPAIAVVTRVGLGKVALMERDFATSQDMTSLSDLRVDKLFGTYALHRIMERQSKVAQGTSIKGMTTKDLFAIKTKIPSYEEQKKIGALFQKLDDLITLQESQVKNHKTLKQAMVQKMFPKEGERVPEIRFQGFTEDWQPKKLKDVLIPGN